LLLVLIVLGAVSQHRTRAAAPVVRSAASPVWRWHITERRHGLAPCGNCGAPNRGDDFCPFCGSALTTSREVHGVTER
jgi:hypothetical protein